MRLSNTSLCALLWALWMALSDALVYGALRNMQREAIAPLAVGAVGGSGSICCLLGPAASW
jgi:hypothetical protein